jgi:pimeloyl-ACP methyl ester carboxylesterase
VIKDYQDWSETFGTQYNVIGFDPRGVGLSQPKLDCYTNQDSVLMSPSHSSPLQELYQFANVSGKHCTHANANSHAKYAGTVATAHDIMHFVTLRHQRPRYEPTETTHSSDMKDGEPKLWYYGISYGTLLGQTIAAMFPDRIGRMILDGNVDGVQHYTGVQPADVDTTDAVFHDFFAACFAAGPENCAYHRGATSVDEIENRYVLLLHSLRKMPAIVDMGSEYGILKDFMVEAVMFKAMYWPSSDWKQLADFLNEVQDGRYIEAYWALNDNNIGRSPASCAFAPSLRTCAPSLGLSPDVLSIITCLDSDKNLTMRSFDDFMDAQEVVQKESYFFGHLWSTGFLLLCVGMDLTPPVSQQFPGEQRPKSSLTLADARRFRYLWHTHELPDSVLESHP